MSSSVFSAASSEQMTVEAIIAAAASTVSVSLAAPQLFVAAMAAGAGAAVGGLAAIAGYGSFLAIRQLHIDYQQATQAFQCRAAQQAGELADFQAQSALASAEAQAQNMRLSATILAYSTVDYLQENIARLQADIASLPSPAPKLAADCLALAARAADEKASVTEVMEQYFQLVGLYRQASLKSTTQSLRELLATEIAALRVAANGAVYATADEERAGMLSQLQVLEQLLPKQTKVARQGIEVLRKRVESDTKRWALQETAERELQQQAGEAVARLQAVSQQQLLPEVRAEASGLLTRLATSLAGDEREAKPLAELIAAAAEIFQRCEKILAEETIARYLREQVTEVLLSMGYQVTPAQGKEQPLLAQLGKDIGLEVQFGEGGALHTQMVALSEQAATQGAQEQERVCKLVDQLFTALKSRDCKIQERFRVSLGKDEELRVIDLPAAEEQIKHETAKQMTKE